MTQQLQPTAIYKINPNMLIPNQILITTKHKEIQCQMNILWFFFLNL